MSFIVNKKTNILNLGLVLRGAHIHQSTTYMVTDNNNKGVEETSNHNMCCRSMINGRMVKM